MMKIIILISFILNMIIAEGVVCSEDELIRELKEDIEDNGLYNILNINLKGFWIV